MCCFSPSRKKALFHFSLIFLQNLTSAHLSINAYIITFRLWPKQPMNEMTRSENWPKRPTLYQVRKKPPPKFGWNNPGQINPGPKWPAFRSNSQFNSPQVPIIEAEPVFVLYNFRLFSCWFVIWISWVKNLEPLVNGPALLLPKR